MEAQMQQRRNIDDNSYPIRVAHLMTYMNYGGVEAVIMNYYRHIDRTMIQFDFFVFEGSELPQRDEIESLGGRIYILPEVKHLGQYENTLTRILKKNHYRIVHANMNTLSVFGLRAAKKAGVPVRICHSHSTAGAGETKKNILKYILRPFSRIYPTELFACSEYAGHWLYGKKTDFYVMHNAIDLEHFRYNEVIRHRIREELGIDNKLVIGHIGRFTPPKNDFFILEIFNEIHMMNPESVMMFIGEGQLEGEVRQRVNELNLTDSVLFLGTKNDCAPYYQAMDAFLLPSLYEGLPVVGVEAQAAGLTCFFSDKVTTEVKVLDTTEMISLDINAKFWAKKILINTRQYKREDTVKKMKKGGYSIYEESDTLREKYLESLQ